MTEWFRQVAGYVLQDQEDAAQLSEVAIYHARWGVLVPFGVGELIEGAQEPTRLAAARDRYRTVLESRDRLLTALDDSSRALPVLDSGDHLPRM